MCRLGMEYPLLYMHYTKPNECVLNLYQNKHRHVQTLHNAVADFYMLL